MRFLIALAVIAITVYSVIDCTRADERQRRGLPAWLWVTVIIVLPGVGGLVWLLVSRLAGEQRPRPPVRPSRPVAPDDDPEFLAGLSRPTPPQPSTPPAPEPEQRPNPPAGPSSDDAAPPAGDDPEEERPTRGEDPRGRRSPE
ncbi:PLD nuclease N-terminal domain-containing protein [Ruania albidiflava]|uniref:PLD nuclease N-terminal domain-containing protein n=1 Tax=Ruania albidiflava TaxID=366586 RepID=UPI0003B5C3F2|nr:PLD nuclease N-terminal domain-containing protein [Ruania albidiflava]